MNTPECAVPTRRLEAAPRCHARRLDRHLHGPALLRDVRGLRALVISNSTSRIDATEPGRPQVAAGVLAVGTGGATLAMRPLVVALRRCKRHRSWPPCSPWMYLIMVGLWRALRVEVSTAGAPGAVASRSAVAGRHRPDTHWWARPSRLGSYPGARAAQRYVKDAAAPAPTDARRGAARVRARGHRGHGPGRGEPVPAAGGRRWTWPRSGTLVYRGAPAAFPTPGFGGSTNRTRTAAPPPGGLHGHGLPGLPRPGYTAEQLINDYMDTATSVTLDLLAQP
ncbi:hypothetical protein QJS66_08890 [Kocuria rhizophila]|nr:hypothetical protein QJS66_08890 [Kocuria rhizophila]